MAVQARFICQTVTAWESGNGKSVVLQAVVSDDPNSPNYSFSQATPSARVEMAITNPDAFEQFQEGRVYDAYFEALEEAQEGSEEDDADEAEPSEEETQTETSNEGE